MSILIVGVSGELSGSKMVFKVWRSFVERRIEVAVAMMVKRENELG